ncbi:hypothetical protein K438DRAFT_1996280 [Mycena galopus ATCC 62051]|nr:hypothetical protein K438DRAFT_1996280 [Mycena galopus ATCC 62051]
MRHRTKRYPRVTTQETGTVIYYLCAYDSYSPPFLDPDVDILASVLRRRTHRVYTVPSGRMVQEEAKSRKSVATRTKRPSPAFEAFPRCPRGTFFLRSGPRLDVFPPLCMVAVTGTPAARLHASPARSSAAIALPRESRPTPVRVHLLPAANASLP